MSQHISPQHEVVREFGRDCIKHPAQVATTSWHRFTVAVITSGQSRPYADSVYMADVLFDGGVPTTKEGIDGPFFTNPNEDRVRGLACWLTGAKEQPGAFDTQLTECICTKRESTYSVWRITAITPCCD